MSLDENNKRLKQITFPSLASLTLVACGGGGGGGLVVPPAPTNRAPVADTDKTVSMDEDATNSALNISAPSDADGDNLTITVTAVPTGGTLTLADGTEVTVNSTLTVSELTGLVFTPDANLNDETTDFGVFTYTVSDSSLSDSSTVTIAVTPVNDAPELIGVMEFAVDENTTAVTDITATDVDGDPLTYSITGGADQALFAIDASTGSLSFNTAPDYENPGDSDQDNIYLVQVTVSDGNGGSTSQSYVITVNDVNENSAPVTSSDIASTNEDTAVSIDVLANDSDPDGDTLSVTAATASNGTVVINSDDTLSYTPNNNFNGTDNITYTVSDGTTTSISTVTVTVNAVNDAPTATIDSSNANLTQNEDAGLITIPSFATNFNIGDGNTFETAGGQELLRYEVALTSGSTNLFDVQPAIAANGTLTFTLKADRNTGAFDLKTHVQKTSNRKLHSFSAK